MNTIIKSLALSALLGSTAHADVTVTVKTSAPWVGYMNVFDLPLDGLGFVFGSDWGPADLVSTFSGSTLTLAPNTIGDPAPFWYTPSGGPGAEGNKIMEANLYVEVNDNSLSDQQVTFTGTVNSNSLTEAHISVAFIKDFAPDYSSFNIETVPLEPGVFSVSLQTQPGPGRHVQYGFQTTGVNVWVTDVAPFGSVVIDSINVPPGNPNVKVDPAAAWQGFMNVFELPVNGGAFVSADPWPTRDLVAEFSGPTLTLKPNSIEDPAFYDSGIGNKTMDANMYVEAVKGTLSGQNVVFSGNVAANTLSGTHTTVAFVKDFAPDYGTVVESTVPLTAGPFSVSLQTIADSNRHIQYGFQVVGPPVPLADIGSFGSVLIDTDMTDSYATWISGFDFFNFTNPDLTQSGDPDGDGLSNFTEFALNSDPTNAASSGKVSAAVGTVAAENAMLLTLPVFYGATFSGSPAESATIGQLNYRIEGSNSLAVFDQPVSEVTPAQSEGLPVPGAGWGYKTFRLDGTVGGASPRGPAGFLRARTSPAP